MTSIIDIRGLDVSYGAAQVLHGLTLNVRAGEIYALLGGNGAGKSTTINALLGFVRPDAGSVTVAGISVADDPLAARARLAYVPENVALYEHLSASENLSYLLHLAGSDHSEATIAQALDKVGLVREAWQRKLGGYSKGMRQKVAIALALARAVPLLLLDEPTSGLDPQATVEFNALIAGLRGQVTVLMVTHDLMGAAEVADHIGFLEHGHIVQQLSAHGPERFDVQALYQRYAGTRRAA